MEKRKQKNSVFYISLILIAIMAVWSVAFNESFTKVSDAAFAFLTTDFGWLYLLAMIVFLVFVLYVAFGRYGKIRLGGDDSRPEYRCFRLETRLCIQCTVPVSLTASCRKKSTAW